MRKRSKTDSEPLRVFLIGSGISRSISPAMHNKAFEKTGFNAKYSLLDVSEEEFGSEIDKIRKESNILGFNITVPFKERIMPYITGLDRQSKSVGAVNTVKISNGRMFGFNTDVDGVKATLSKLGIGKNSKRCVILGAGGAAKGCAYTVLKSGFRSLTILNRSIDRATTVALHFKELFPKASIVGLLLTTEDFVRSIENCDLLINAITSSRKFPIHADFRSAPKRMRFFDLGYREASPILKKATRIGLKSTNGLTMLVEQAAKSFEIWTGDVAPRKSMLAAAKKELSRITDFE